MRSPKEQFEEAINKQLHIAHTNIEARVNCAEKCETIADTQSIEFAKWLYEQLRALPKEGLIANTHKEMLEVFKEQFYK